MEMKIEDDYEVDAYELVAYVDKRENEIRRARGSEFNSVWACVFSFFGGLGRDASSKISAAKKCIQILNGEEGVSFDPNELAACANGRLEALIEKNSGLKEKILSFAAPEEEEGLQQ